MTWGGRSIPFPLVVVLLLGLGLGLGSIFRDAVSGQREPSARAQAAVQLIGFDWAQDRPLARYRVTVVNLDSESMQVSNVALAESASQSRTTAALTPIGSQALPVDIPPKEVRSLEVQRVLADCPAAAASPEATPVWLSVVTAAVTARLNATAFGALREKSVCQLADVHLPPGWRNPVRGRVVPGPHPHGELHIDAPISTVGVSSLDGGIAELADAGGSTLTVTAPDTVLLTLRRSADSCDAGASAKRVPRTGFTVVTKTASQRGVHYVIVGPELARWLIDTEHVTCP